MSEPNPLSNNPDEDIAPLSPFGPIDYEVTPEQLAALAAGFSGITEITDRKSFEVAQKALTKLKTARTGIEAKRKDLKAASLEFGREVDAMAKDLQAITEPEEARLQALVDADKQRREEAKAEKERIERERINNIQKAMNQYRTLPVELRGHDSAAVLETRDKVEAWEISEDEFQEFTEEARELKAQVIEELNELYAGALHDERIAEEERKAREAEDARRKAEAEQLAKDRAEAEKRQREIDAENERRERELAEREAKFQAEKDALEAEKRAEAERAEQERLAKEQAEAEAKAEQERIERAKRTAPDREKMDEYINSLLAVEKPRMTSEEGKDAAIVLNHVVAGFEERLIELRDGLA